MLLAMFIASRGYVCSSGVRRARLLVLHSCSVVMIFFFSAEVDRGVDGEMGGQWPFTLRVAKLYFYIYECASIYYVDSYLDRGRSTAQWRLVIA